MITEREITEIVSKQYEFFDTSVTHSYEFRINELQKLKKKIKKFENQFNAALKKNLGKSVFESYATEVGFILHDLTNTIKNLKKWMKPKKVKTPLLVQPENNAL